MPVDVGAWVVALGSAMVALVAGYFVARRRYRPPISHTVVPPRARQILRAVPHAVMVASGDGRLMFSNDKGRELGVALTTGMVTEPMRNLVARAVEHGELVEFATTVRRRHATADNQLLAIAMPVAGEDLAVISVFDAGSPISARNAHREFVVNVSHELKTPIGAIALVGEALESAADDPVAVRRLAQTLQKESRRLHELVLQFIELSRVQASDTVIESRPERIRDCIDDAVGGLLSFAEDRKITIDTSAVQDVGLACERRSTAMAIRNVVENAIRYSPPHSRVTVTARRRRDRLLVGVLDQGIGMADADQEKVFERFYRAGEARDRETGGTGIGLAIVKHVMRQHGGAVELWSEPGVGSTFTLVFPVDADE